MQKSSHSEDEYRNITITLRLDAETNKLLTESAKRSNRTKRTEAELRFADHVRRFRTISEIGDATSF